LAQWEQFGKRRNKEEERKNGKNERKDLTLTGLLMEGLESTWLENAHFAEVERHPLYYIRAYARVREIFDAGEGIVRDSVGF
jgi:hypothetical protein